AYGQGASAALPIFGKFMSRVYADPSLPYSQDTRFEFPAGIDLCERTDYGPMIEPEPTDAAIEGIFE
ncbi:MAG: hypothetical protein K2M97_07480, partial [Muribaculaceae bacterium]|nr:hypothetical protein [Muribaculaceae bacterium]